LFIDGANQRIYTSADTNVGIGITSPLSRLDINVGVAKTDTTLYGYPSLILRSNESSNYSNLGINFIGGSTQANRGFQFQTGEQSVANSGNILFQPYGGNVGIGITSSLSTRLTIAGPLGSVVGGGSSAIKMINTDTGNYASIGAGIVGITNAGMQLSVDGTSSIAINGIGNVGIGTTNPNHMLDITTNKTGNSAGSTVRLNRPDSSSYENAINWATNGVSKWFLGSDNNGTDNFYLYNWARSNYEITVLSSSGNVGINTTSPTATLTVSKVASNFMFDLENFTEAEFKLRTYNSGSTGAGTAVFTQGLYYSTNENGAIKFHRGGGGTDGFLTFSTTATERVRIDANGNVGIGTVTPGFKLDVNGDAATRGTEYIFQSVNSTTGYLYFDHSGTQVWKQGIFNDNTSTFAIGNGAGFSRLFNITNAGNVGIGTTSPGDKLDVVGYSVFGPTVERLSIGGSALGFNRKVETGAIYSSSISAYQFNHTGNSTNTSDYLALQVYNGNGTQVTANAIAINGAGNVGIGTASPSYRLDIVSSGSLTSASGNQVLSQRIQASTGNNDYLEITNTRVIDGTDWQSAGFRIQQKVDFTWMGYIQFNGNNNGGISFGTGTTTTSANTITERMRIDGNGSVGIGIYPRAKLDVNGAIIIQTNNNLSWGNTYGAGVPTIAAVSGSSAFIAFYPAGSTSNEKVRINSDGYVGIGETNPVTKLTVVSSGAGTDAARFTDGNRADLVVSFPSSSYSGLDSYFGSNAGGFIFRNGTSEAARITTAGNVSIGATSDSYKLSVAGNVQLGTNQTRPVVYDSGVGNFKITPNAGGWATGYLFNGSSGTYRGGFGGYGDANNLTYYWIGPDYNVPTMVITSGSTALGGYVGIGDANPSTALDVNGTTISKLYGGNRAAPAYAQFEAYMAISDPTYGNNYAYFGLHRGGAVSWQLGMISSSFVIAKGGGASQFTLWPDRYFAISDAGNVGVGTITPQKPLEVISNSNDFVSVGVNQLADEAWTGIHFGYRENNNSYRKSAIVFQRTDLTENNAQGKIHILNGPQSGGGNATLSDAKITIAEDGNVGIGTPTPSNKLHVSGSTYVTGVFSTLGGGSSILAIRDASIEQQNSTSDSGTVYINYYGYNGSDAYYRDLSIHDGKGGQIAIFDGSTSRVGILQGTPQSPLDVNGVTRTGGSVFGKSILSTSPGSIAYYKLATLPSSNSGTYDHIVIEGVINGTWQAADSYPFKILLGNRGSNANQFFFGPGSTYQGDKASVVVYIESDSSRTVWLKFDANYYTLMSVNVISSINVTTYPNFPTGTPTGTLNWSSATNLPLTYYDMANSRFGIGTTTPSEKLHVSGNIKLNNGNAVYFGDSANNNGGRIYVDNTTNNFYVNQANNSPLYFATNNSTRATILGGGNFGIGTTEPISKLDVEGGYIRAGNAASTNGSKILWGNYTNGALTTFGSMYSSGGPVIGYGVTPSTSADGSFLSSTGIAISRGAYYIQGQTHRWYAGDSQTVSVDSVVTMTNTMTLSNVGTLTVTSDIVAYGSPSDSRLKDIKEKVPNALDTILKLNGYKFDWKESDSILQIKEDIGVIAQEVEEVAPELVRTNKETGMKSVRYQGLTAILIEAIKEQQKQIDELKYLLKNK
jgi:hypothetical protein